MSTTRHLNGAGNDDTDQYSLLYLEAKAQSVSGAWGECHTKWKKAERGLLDVAVIADRGCELPAIQL